MTMNCEIINNKCPFSSTRNCLVAREMTLSQLDEGPCIKWKEEIMFIKSQLYGQTRKLYRNPMTCLEIDSDHWKRYK